MNVISVFFGGGRTAKTQRLTQYDYGQMLKVEDVELPGSYQVHFANEGDTETKTQLGDKYETYKPQLFSFLI